MQAVLLLLLAAALAGAAAAILVERLGPDSCPGVLHPLLVGAPFFATAALLWLCLWDIPVAPIGLLLDLPVAAALRELSGRAGCPGYSRPLLAAALSGAALGFVLHLLACTGCGRLGVSTLVPCWRLG